jgi:hypothetical protein
VVDLTKKIMMYEKKIMMMYEKKIMMYEKAGNIYYTLSQSHDEIRVGTWNKVCHDHSFREHCWSEIQNPLSPDDGGVQARP